MYETSMHIVTENICRPEETNETIKCMLDELRKLSMSNYENIANLRNMICGVPVKDLEYPDRSSMAHDILGDLIIQKSISDVLTDIYKAVGV